MATGERLLPEVSAPGEEGTRTEVVEVALVGVGFALEGYVEIGGDGATMDDEPHEPLHAVPQEEEHEEHLQLLTRVDALVVGGHGAQLTARDDDAANVDGVEVLEI